MAIAATEKAKTPPATFKLHDRMIAAKVGYQNGQLEGLYEALRLLVQFGGTAPDWVLGGALKIVKEHLDTAVNAKGGPGANKQSHDKFDEMHIRRWRLATAFLDAGFSKTATWLKTNRILAAHGDPTVVAGAIRASYTYVEAIRTDPLKRRQFKPWMFQSEQKVAGFITNPEHFLKLADGTFLSLSVLKKLTSK
jgi:hypothetical protein